MLSKLKCHQNTNVTKTQCHQTRTSQRLISPKTQISTKRKYHQSTLVTKCKCHQNANFPKTQMSTKLKYHKNLPSGASFSSSRPSTHLQHRVQGFPAPLVIIKTIGLSSPSSRLPCTCSIIFKASLHLQSLFPMLPCTLQCRHKSLRAFVIVIKSINKLCIIKTIIVSVVLALPGRVE